MIACNNDANFPNAKEYRPERWLDEKRQFTVNVPNACIVVPFGIGRRTCPGKRFVEMEVMLLLAKVRKNLHISMLDSTLILIFFIIFGIFLFQILFL